MDAPGTIALLLGPQHTALGTTATADLGPGLAAALSPGRFAKGYPAAEPNEDGVVVGEFGGCRFAAVADGHNGFAAAGIALDVLAAAAPALDPTRPADAVRDLAAAAGEAVVARLRGSGMEASRTTLVVACLIGDRGAVASLGDSAAFLVGPRRVRRLPTTPGFLGVGTGSGTATVRTLRLRRGGTVILASDGFVDFLGRGLAAAISADAARSPTASTLACSLVERAFAGGAGDNISVAVLRAPSEA